MSFIDGKWWSVVSGFSFTVSGGGGGRSCYKCGESGHISRNCTKGNDDHGECHLIFITCFFKKIYYLAY